MVSTERNVYEIICDSLRVIIYAMIRLVSFHSVAMLSQRYLLKISSNAKTAPVDQHSIIGGKFWQSLLVDII